MCVSYVQHEFSIQTYIKSYGIDKISIFHELLEILHIHKNRNFFTIIGKRYINSLYPITFMAGIWQENTFSFLPVVSR